jgi:purine-binding chemotaxis protein CheW
MSLSSQYLIFRLDEQRCAVPLSAVERIVGAVEITPLPKAPGVVLGVLDVSGDVRPVLSLRQRFHRPERDLRLADQFLLAHAGTRTVALVIDEAVEIRTLAESDIVPAGRIVPGVGQVRGVAVLADGLVLIHDLETFLSLEEVAALDAALSAHPSHGH